MYSKKTRVLCYAFTLPPTLIGLALWKAPETSAFPTGILLTPVLLALVLTLCLYMSGKLEQDKQKNKKINAVVIWIIPVLSNVTFWISYALVFRGLELPVARIMGWLFGAMYLVLGNYMPKCRQNSTVGIRVKWTASTEENWNATHRMAGPCYMACGFLMLVGSFLPEKAAIPCFIVLLVLGNAIPMAYSYGFYRKQKRQGVAFRPRPKWEDRMTKGTLIFVAAILLFCAVFLFTGSVKVQFLDAAMQVDVTYYGSTTIPYSEIAATELRNENMDGSRTWGLGSFRLLAGQFENAEFGTYTRMTYYNPHSAIVLKTAAGKTYVLSGRDPAETQSLYENILAHLH